MDSKRRLKKIVSQYGSILLGIHTKLNKYASGSQSAEARGHNSWFNCISQLSRE